MKRKNRSPLQKAKKKTNDWCSRYIRIKAAIEYGDTFDPRLGKCYTCKKLVDITRAHAGHFKSRGLGGSSGLYFNEMAIRLQCIQCNAFEQGRPKEFREHLVEEYDEDTVELLEALHKVNSYTLFDIVGLRLHFKAEVEKMCKEHRIKPWW